ncbi:MAG: pyruvate dehydrogenase (acetyl-transferring) E1 component subunit alpha [Alphaproteobacteria bacterium]
MRSDSKPEAGHTAVTFSISFTRYLLADGTIEAALPEFGRDPAALVPFYRAMVLTRIFDEKAVALQRTGRLGTFASSLGQEAVGVGTASAMRAEDLLVPSFRDQAAQLWRGVTLKELFLYWGGDERGSNFADQREDFPVCIPVASHFPHAAGIALAFQLRKEQRVAVCIAGDGATSKGDFYEGINIAAVWDVPAVFIINDNQWAISVPRARQTAARTLAQKAIAVGMPGEQVDGNDVIAVHDAVSRALERARDGGGPTLIEAMSYRLCDHTTADDAHRYRSDAEVSSHWKEEPVARLRSYLVSQEAWSKKDEEKLLSDSTAQVNSAAEEYLAMPPQSVADIFDYLFAELPEDLKAQRDFAIAHIGEYPDG